MPISAYRPRDSYHPYLDDWESTEVDSDVSRSVSEVLEEAGKSMGTIFLEVPPSSKERAERYAIFYQNHIPAYAYSTTPPPPLPAINHPTPASHGSLHDTSAESSSEAPPSRHTKRARVQDTESSGSQSDRPRKTKRTKRPVLRSIGNKLSIASPSVPHLPRVVEAQPSSGAPAPLPAPTRAPTPALGPRKPRRTVGDLQKAVRTKALPANNDSHICKIDGCLTPLLAEELKTARKHIARHYTTTGSLACLRPGCTKVYKDFTSVVRHFETHLPWIYPCPNAWCTQGPFTRADVQKRHIKECEHVPKNDNDAVPEPENDDDVVPDPADDGYAADSEVEED